MKEIEEIARLLGQDNPIVRKEMLRMEHGLTNLREAEKLMSRLLKRKKGIDLKDMGPYSPVDHEVVGSGDVFFAMDWETGGKPISLLPSLANTTLMGMTGKGKTNLIRLLVCLFINLRIAQVKVIDFLGNFIDLPRFCENTVCLDTPSLNLMFNDGVPQQRWINVLFDLVAFHTDTMIGGRSFLNRTNAELARRFEGTGERYCMQDLAEYMQWLLRRRKLNQSDRGYCERITGKPVSWDAESEGAFAFQRGIVESLDSCNQVISLRGLSEELQRFYVSVLMARDFMKRVFDPELSRSPLVYVVDEAKHVFSHKDERPGVKSGILSMLTQTRNVGMFWIVATQEPSKLAHTCLANSPTKIILGISEGLDLSVIQQSLRLNSSQVKEISRFEESGLAVIKFSEGYTEPFLARINLFEEPPEDTEHVAEKNRRQLKDAEELIVSGSGLLQRELFAREEEQDVKYGKISNSAKRLLSAYGKEPYRCLTDLYEASGLGTKGSKAKKELALGGLIKDRDISVKSKRGPRKSLLNITEKGKSWLREARIKPLVTGKGGPRELYYSFAIEEWAARKGFAVHREYKGADLMLVQGDGEKVAVEIACRKENQVTNIKRDLGTGIFSKIVVACESEKVLREVKAEYVTSEIDPKACEVTLLLVNELML